MNIPEEPSSVKQEEPLVTIPQRENLKSLVLRMARSTIIVVAVLALVVFWLNSTGLSTGLLLGDMSLKPPTDDDRLQAQKAAEEENAGLCGNISKQASLVRPFDREGRQASFLESECYFNLAVKLNDDMACANVHPVASGWLDGSALTPESCMGMVRLSRNRIRSASPGKNVTGMNTAAPLAANKAEGLGERPAVLDSAKEAFTDRADKADYYEKQNEQQPKSDHDKKTEQEKYQDAWNDWKRRQKKLGN